MKFLQKKSTSFYSLFVVGVIVSVATFSHVGAYGQKSLGLNLGHQER